MTLAPFRLWSRGAALDVNGRPCRRRFAISTIALRRFSRNSGFWDLLDFAMSDPFRRSVPITLREGMGTCQ